MVKNKKINFKKELKNLTIQAIEEGKSRLEEKIRELSKKGKLSAQTIKKALKEIEKEWEKTRQKRLLKDLKELGIPTKKDFENLKKEIEQLKKKI